MGADNVDFLHGRAGETDVLDCVTATNVALKKYPWLNPQKVILSGGSYGGFLNAHLSAQHPVRFFVKYAISSHVRRSYFQALF